MIGTLKILFDISFYYAISTYFMYLGTRTYPSVWGIPILVITIALYIAVGGRKPITANPNGGVKINPISIIFCIIPAVFFIFRPSLAEIIQFLPAWLYLGFVIWMGLYSTNRILFTTHFGFTGKFYFLYFAGIFWINSGNFSEAINGAVPYIVVYLLTGVCLMRILREEGKLPGRRNITVVLTMLLACVALVTLQAPQLLASAWSFFYNNVITWVLMGGILLIGSIMMIIVRAIMFLLGLFVKNGEFDVTIDMSGSASEVFGDENGYIEQNGAWIEIVGTIILILLIILVLYFIAKKIMGVRASGKMKGLAYVEERENLDRRDRGRIGGLLRPKDPRQAVRWYYRKYLKEGASRRGTRHALSDTSLHVMRCYAPYFPSGESNDLRDVYVIARYSSQNEINKSQADSVSELWRKLKTTKQ